MSTPIVLRYFDARGRAQFLRNFLHCRAPGFVDERVPLSPTFEEWTAIKSDRARTGPLQRLPVLEFGDRLVPEALVIRQFLHEKLGDAERLSEEENIAHAALVSSLYLDVMLPVGILIWAEVFLQGVDLPAFAKQTLARIQGLFGFVDRWLGELDWHRSSLSRPVMLADCLLWDQLDAVQHAFGAAFSLRELPVLARIYAEAPGRAEFEAVRDGAPAALTGRGLVAENDVLARIRGMLAG